MMRSLCVRLMLAGMATGGLCCGTPGVVEVHRVVGSERAAPTAEMSLDADAGIEDSAGECPASWTCMDIVALGYEATDVQGDPVKASCSMGGILPCDDDDPASTCEGLTDPICVHLMLGGQEIVSCGQRCAP